MFVSEVMTCFKGREMEDNILMGVKAFRKKPRVELRRQYNWGTIYYQEINLKIPYKIITH